MNTEAPTAKKRTTPTDGGWRSISPRVWVSFAMATIAQLVSGSNYAFSAWSDTMNQNYEYGQGEILLVGSLGNAGQYLGPATGMLVDLYGIKISGYFAGCAIFTGYFLMYLTSRGFTPILENAGLQGLCLMIASLGSSTLYTSALVSSIRTFPERYRASVVGWLVGIYALCATMLVGIYNTGFGGTDLGGYQLFVAVAMLAVSFAAANILLPVDTSAQEEELPIEEKRLLEDGGKVAASSPPTLGRVQRVIDVLLEKVVSGTFWLIFIIFFLGAGAGLLHINNFGQLMKALNGGADAADAILICVTIQSVFNAVGRISIGVTDLVKIRRGWFLFAGMVLMAFAHLLSAFVFTEGEANFSRVYGITVLIGFAYGIIWSTTPTIVSETWSTRDFGMNWGWVNLAAAAASFAFNGAAGALYDHQITVHENNVVPAPTDENGNDLTNDCAGKDCFRNAYFFAAGMAALGAVFALILVPRTQYGKKDDDDVEEETAAAEFAPMKKRKRSSLAVVGPKLL